MKKLGLQSSSRLNSKLQRIAKHLIHVEQPGEDFTEKKVQWYRLTDYQLNVWERAYPITIKSIRPADKLLFKYEFTTTNLELTFASDPFEHCHQREAMENLIKEVKTTLILIKWIVLVRLTTLECCLLVWLIT